MGCLYDVISDQFGVRHYGMSCGQHAYGCGDQHCLNPPVILDQEPETRGYPTTWPIGKTRSQSNNSNKTGILKLQCKITCRFDREEDMNMSGLSV